MKHLEPRQEVCGEQVQVPLPVMAMPHFGVELAKPLTAKREHRHWRLAGQRGRKKKGAEGAGGVGLVAGWEGKGIILKQKEGEEFCCDCNGSPTWVCSPGANPLLLAASHGHVLASPGTPELCPAGATRSGPHISLTALELPPPRGVPSAEPIPRCFPHCLHRGHPDLPEAGGGNSGGVRAVPPRGLLGTAVPAQSPSCQATGCDDGVAGKTSNQGKQLEIVCGMRSKIGSLD